MGTLESAAPVSSVPACTAGGLTTRYSHLSSISVGVGDTEAIGDVVGEVGCTGLCTGPHLHFETWEWGTPVDPMGYLR
jgi:murein DD-endopeptidase MepM/ murein hydrolase activator NlpD